MFSDNQQITVQLKTKSYGYDKSNLQQIQYKLISSVTGKYSNTVFLNGFFDLLTKRVFNPSISTNTEERFMQLNIFMLYVVHIIKTYEYPNFDEKNINNPKYKSKILELFRDILQIDNKKTYDDYSFDLLRYLTIYDQILK